LSRAPINTGLQAGDSPLEMEPSRFNGLDRGPRSISRCGLRYQHEKAVENGLIAMSARCGTGLKAGVNERGLTLPALKCEMC
jgi:hypothetical protein